MVIFRKNDQDQYEIIDLTEGKVLGYFDPAAETFYSPAVDTDVLQNRGLASSRSDAGRRLVGTHGPMPAQTATMEDITHWEANQGTKSADTENVYRGSQSLKLDNGGSGSLRANLRIGTEFSESWDLTDLRLDFAMRIDAATDTEFTVTIRYYDTSGNTLNFKREFDTTQESEWKRINPSVNSENGAVDISAVDIIQINIDNSPSDSLSMNIDDVRFVETPDQGYVIHGFDDAVDSQYSTAMPILEKYGQSAYIAANPDTIGSTNRMTWSELREWYDSGRAVVNHTDTHAQYHDENLTLSEVEEEVQTGKEKLLNPPDGGGSFLNGQSAFVYPGGQYDGDYKEVVNGYHQYAFCTQAASRCGANPIQQDTLQMPRGQPTGSASIDALIGTNDGADQGVLDLVADYNQLAHLYYHGIGSGSNDSITESQFDRLCEYIANKDGLDVIGWNEYVRRFGQPTW